MYLGGLCFIVSGTEDLTCLEAASMSLKAGVRWLQYREKNKDRRGLYIEALALRLLTSKFSAVLTINDYADIALAVSADGLHIGQEDLPLTEARKLLGPGKIIGLSTHSVQEARRAEAEGADYIGFGPVFGSLTKDAGPPKGIAEIRRIRASVRLPVVAIGGINHGNIESVLSAGADAAAVASAILRGDAEGNARMLLEALKPGGKEIPVDF